MPYTNFRFIAYEVPTVSVDGGNNVVSGWAPGPAPPAVARLPVPGGLDPDATSRLRRLAAVVDQAATYVAQPTFGDNAATLKVFVVPEFYFRPPSGGQPTWRWNTYPGQIGQSVLKALSKMFVDPAFTDWLFVCGTLMWNTTDDTFAAPVFHNTAVVIEGGPAAPGQSTTWAIEKKLASGIDGLQDCPAGHPKLTVYYQSWAFKKAHVLPVKGIEVGVEICLDHLDSDLTQVLKSTVVSWAANAGGAPQPDLRLHILAAGGMPVKHGSVAAKVNGYLLRNDGHTGFPGSQLLQVTGYDFDPLGITPGANPWDPNSYAQLASIGARPPVALAPALQVANPYRAMPQRLMFYPSLAMP
jgi:hypothetical protein